MITEECRTRRERKETWLVEGREERRRDGREAVTSCEPRVWRGNTSRIKGVACKGKSVSSLEPKLAICFS